MRNPKYPLIALAAYLALVGTLAVTTSRPATGQNGQPHGPDVRVINKTTEPVPVTLQGTAGPVPVSIQGTAQIDTSSPIPVRDVDRQVQQPVQFSLFNPPGNTYTVPAGKQLVIEYVSGGLGITSSGGAFAEIFIEVSPGITHIIPGTPVSYADGNPGGLGFAFSQPCRIYAGPGATVKFHGSQGVLLSTLNVSGYLVDAP